ncbi:PepSY domain-containing protein [Roseinatronobacter monicus]|uniref:PepSY domain-containing protein n=1 Tax=Roseinatronobacter monicus TaxID=393481 RepID=UPI003F3AE6F3
MKLRYIFPMALALSAGPALADRTPPAKALALSEIVAALESQYDIHFIDDIDWDDNGYWDVEFFTRDGAKVDLKIDPVTGRPHG